MSIEFCRIKLQFDHKYQQRKNKREIRVSGQFVHRLFSFHYILDKLSTPIPSIFQSHYITNNSDIQLANVTNNCDIIYILCHLN